MLFPGKLGLIPDFGLGGNYKHSYRYDDLDRLISAEGDSETRDEKHSYTLSMKYDNRYSIMNKVQTHKSISKTDGETTDGEHHLSYQYDGDTPSAPSRIGSRLYSYDANGNPTSWIDTASGDFRQMIWDEENRMSAISVNGADLCFTYDHAGERIVKSTSTNDMLFVNGKFMGSIQHGEDFTAYVSPMFTYTKDRFTKHYYVGGERVSSRIGSGQFSNKFDQATNPVITAGNQNYVKRMAQLNSESTSELARRYDLPPGPATNKGIYEKLLLEGKLEVTENPNYVAPEETTYDIPRGWPKYPVFPDSGSAPGPPIQFEELTPDSVRAGYTFTDPNMIGEVDEYFYHGDHISSVVLVTDKRATIVQSFAYMPYGELLVEDSSVDLDYRFSAKETDRETGLSYFGARYYDPTAAVWLGTDPVFHAGSNAYAYCLGNPINLVDPNGMEEYFAENGDHIGSGTNADDKSKYIIKNKKDLNIIKKNKKVGIETDINDLSSAYKLPSDAVLSEALDVLQRTIDNGGVREESSVVRINGDVVRGDPGEIVMEKTEVAGAKLPDYKFPDSEVEASIHSHPLVTFNLNDEFGATWYDAAKVGPGDPSVFLQYNCNIIVGKIGTPFEEKNPNKQPPFVRYIDNRPLGICIYGRNTKVNQRSNIWLRKETVLKIINFK